AAPCRRYRVSSAPRASDKTVFLVPSVAVAPPPEHRRLLDEMGYVKLDGFIAPARRQRLADRIDALFAFEGAQAVAELRRAAGARRLANLVDKGDAFVECILEPGVLAHVGYVLGPRFKLSSLNAR